MAFSARDPSRPLPLPAVRADDRFAYPEDSTRSHFTAFLMGGVVVAGGLLAFLYYDTNGLEQQPGREPFATGSIMRSSTPATLPSIDVTQPGPPAAP